MSMLLQRRPTPPSPTSTQLCLSHPALANKQSTLIFKGDYSNSYSQQKLNSCSNTASIAPTGTHTRCSVQSSPQRLASMFLTWLNTITNKAKKITNAKTISRLAVGVSSFYSQLRRANAMLKSLIGKRKHNKQRGFI